MICPFDFPSLCHSITPFLFADETICCYENRAWMVRNLESKRLSLWLNVNRLDFEVEESQVLSVSKMQGTRSSIPIDKVSRQTFQMRF